MDKPANWSSLPLYKKVEIYGTQLKKEIAPFVDKIAVKPLVVALSENKVKVAKVIRELRTPFDINPSDINPNHLLKAAHGSSWHLDLAIKPSIEDIRITIQSWNYIYSKKEIQYTYLKPRFFIEEKIPCRYTGKSGKAHDIKVHCIKGEPYFMLLRKDQHLRNYYDTHWNPVMPLEFEFEKPHDFDKILDLCRVLSKPFEYVRVDLYMGTDGIYFSEYTFTPHGGKQRLSDEVEMKYGKLWT